MSRTFFHKGRRVDFDYWMYPDLSQDLDFDILASMVTGASAPTVAFGQEMILEHHRDVVQVSSRDNFQFAVGAALTAWGTAMLVPGIVDVAAFSIGSAIGGPVGGVIAVVVYNVFALIVLGTGLVLMYTA